MSALYILLTGGNALSHCSFEDAILNFLYDHIDKSGENQARVKWEPNTVVIWDNRVTAHVCPDLFLVSTHFTKLGVQSAILDFEATLERRHGARITPQAERPIPANENLKL